jgi:Na+-transporting NADH:ubiquinone oxidoreductase subunit A
LQQDNHIANCSRQYFLRGGQTIRIHVMKFTIRQGLDIPIKGSPRQVIEDGARISSVALTGRDLRGLRPTMLVRAGERVAVGQPLFHDRVDAKVMFTSPAAGIVSRIDRSRRSNFETLEILCDGGEAFTFNTSGKVREILQKSGLWTTLTGRPFGNIPASQSKADAILVTAIDTNPLAPDPAVVVQSAGAEFEFGLEKLASLTDGPTIVCQAPGPPMTTGKNDAIVVAEFRGKHPAGLSGTHLDRLGLLGKPVWQIGYQDVIAIGHLFLTRHLSTERIVAVAGPMARNPRLLRTRRGANLSDLSAGEAVDGEVTVFSGSVLSGRPAAFLGHLHVQLCLMQAPKRKAEQPYSEREHRKVPMPMLPMESFETVLPQNILPVPLMRALSVGDWETACRLGATDLLEEDVALLSMLCTSGADYAALLRRALDDFAGFS